MTYLQKRVHFKKHIFLLTARIYAIIKLIFYRLIDKEGKTAVATPSELFFERTKKRSIYNIQPISNIPSIIRQGVLSYKCVTAMKHTSIAMEDVQSRRDNVIIPNGGPLHSYANAYFDPRNPMMYKRQSMAQSLCVLAISSVVLDFKGTVISDGNAASEYSRFYSPEEGIKKLNFAQIYSKWWTDDDPYEQLKRKRIKCAEILVPDKIDFEYIIGAIVVNEKAQHDLESLGFQKTIMVHPKVFFWREG